MRAIVLAAGQGTRLRPMTDDKPKCLVPYQGRPLLEHALRSLRAAGVREVSVVAGYAAEQVQAALAEDDDAEVVVNPAYETTNMVASLFCARPRFEEDCLVVYGDILFGSALVAALLQTPAPFATVVNTRWRELWERRMEDPLADAETMRIDEEGHIVELGKRPRNYEEVEGQFTGLILLRRPALQSACRLWDHLAPEGRYEGRTPRQMYMTTFLQLMIDEGAALRAVPYPGGWMEIDSREDLEVAEAHGPAVLGF